MGIIGASRVGKCVDDASVDDGKCGGGGFELESKRRFVEAAAPVICPFGTHNRIFSRGKMRNSAGLRHAQSHLFTALQFYGPL